jgi:hypothetical protein
MIRIYGAERLTAVFCPLFYEGIQLFIKAIYDSNMAE